jgi:hypothetical protein
VSVTESEEEDGQKAVIFSKHAFFGVLLMVGELYNYGLIDDIIILKGLLKILLMKKFSELVLEEIEGVCKLLMACGQKLDSLKCEEFNLYMVRLKKIAFANYNNNNNNKNKNSGSSGSVVPFRVRVLIEQVIEMRASNWQSAESAKKVGKYARKINEPYNNNNNNNKQNKSNSNSNSNNNNNRKGNRNRNRNRNEDYNNNNNNNNNNRGRGRYAQKNNTAKNRSNNQQKQGRNRGRSNNRNSNQNQNQNQSRNNRNRNRNQNNRNQNRNTYNNNNNNNNRNNKNKNKNKNNNNKNDVYTQYKSENRVRYDSVFAGSKIKNTQNENKNKNKNNNSDENADDGTNNVTNMLDGFSPFDILTENNDNNNMSDNNTNVSTDTVNTSFSSASTTYYSSSHPSTTSSSSYNNNSNNNTSAMSVQRLKGLIDECLVSYCYEDIIQESPYISHEVWSLVICDIFLNKRQSQVMDFIDLFMTVFIDHSSSSNAFCDTLITQLVDILDDSICDCPKFLDFIALLFARLFSNNKSNTETDAVTDADDNNNTVVINGYLCLRKFQQQYSNVSQKTVEQKKQMIEKLVLKTEQALIGVSNHELAEQIKHIQC